MVRAAPKSRGCWTPGPSRSDGRTADGPPALKPAALGSGLTLVQREIAYALGGSVDLSFQPSGLTVTLTFPMEDAST